MSDSFANGHVIAFRLLPNSKTVCTVRLDEHSPLPSGDAATEWFQTDQQNPNIWTCFASPTATPILALEELYDNCDVVEQTQTDEGTVWMLELTKPMAIGPLVEARMVSLVDGEPNRVRRVVGPK